MGNLPDREQKILRELTCQVCGSNELEELLDLGYQPLCNEFWPSGEASRPQTYYPLRLCHCLECSLVQLDYVLPTEYTFGDQYTYLTGTSKSLQDYYSQLARQLTDRFELRPGDTVIDIGSNDGTFLKAFQSLGINVLGIEGAQNSVEFATASGVPTLPKFFGQGVSAEIKENLTAGSHIRLITAMNVLAHTDNINQFLPEVAALMGPDTVFVSQSHWLVALTKSFEFDTIYHEHLRYYTLKSLTGLLNRHGLNLIDAEAVDFYGGSILCYATKNDGGKSQSLLSLLQEEEEANVVESLKSMKQVLLRNKARLINLLVELKLSGKRVAGIGAPMKASTLLNFYGITSDLVEHIGEVNPLKVGTVVPGVGIPVVHEDVVLKEQPDYALLLSWNMANQIIPKYRSIGYTGKFILPVPEVKVID